jgi:hypothetical protein
MRKQRVSLTVKERKTMIEQGRRAAVARAGAFTCPYVDDEDRFTAWIEGYELGEQALTKSEADTPSPSAAGFWSSVKPISRYPDQD